MYNLGHRGSWRLKATIIRLVGSALTEQNVYALIRNQPITLFFNLLCYAAVLIIMLKNKSCAKSIFTIHMPNKSLPRQFRKTVLLECIIWQQNTMLDNDCSIRVYQSFIANLSPIIMLMLLLTYYTQNCAGIISCNGWFLALIVLGSDSSRPVSENNPEWATELFS